MRIVLLKQLYINCEQNGIDDKLNIKKKLLHKFNTELFTGFYTYPLVLGTEATTRPSCRQLKKHEKHNLRLNFKYFSGKTISN